MMDPAPVVAPPEASPPPSTAIPSAVHAKRWWTLVTLCLGLTIIGIDSTILNVAIPSIVRETGATGGQVQWIVDSYTIVFACLLLTAGALGDRYGRKHALTFGLVIFGFGSFAAALTSSPSMLIVTRSIMGIGGAFIFPTTLSILTNTFEGKERARAIGIWAGVSGIGVALGPLLGGLLVEHFWWGSVFLVNVPVCAVAIVMTYRYVYNSKNPDEHRLDLVGAGLSILALVSLLFAIIEAPDAGWTSTTVIVPFGLALIFLTAFARWELHTEHPMLQLRFFKNPRFSAASATITLMYFALFGTTFLLTQYFQFVLGYSPFTSGFMTSAVAIGLMAAAPFAPRLVERIGTKKVVVLGLSVIFVALLMYTSGAVMESTLWGWIVRLGYGVGMGLTAAPVTESIMGSLPRGEAGVGSAVNDTTRQTGGALGVAILGTIVAARYHSLIEAQRALVPAGSYHEVHDSIGKALDATRHMSPKDAAAVAQVAKESYFQATQVTYVVAACVVLGAIFIAAKFLPAHAESIPGEVMAASIPESID